MRAKPGELPGPPITRLRAQASQPKLACWSLATGGALPRCPRVVFVRVKKTRDLLFQLRRLARLGHADGVLEKLLLDGSGQIIPLQEHGRSKALQDTLLCL